MNDTYKKTMLLLLGMMLFLANGDNYAAAALLSEIATDLNITLSEAATSVISYMLAFGAFTLVFGPLSDRYGKVRVFNAASMGTAIFSILGAVSFNLPSLIVFRAMNGLFGAGIFPIALALIGDSFDDQNRQAAVGKVMGLAFLGAATATAIGGALAYFGSWRLVYLAYGIAELALAIAMMRMLEKDEPASDRISSFDAYRRVLTDFRFVRLTCMTFLQGFTVFGSFTYAGILIQQSTQYSVLTVGLILSIFGIGTVAGGRITPLLKRTTKNGFLIITATLGAGSLYIMSAQLPIGVTALGLFGFGTAFIMLQSTLASTLMGMHPEVKGTVMSMSGFNVFLGGACGTAINAALIKTYEPAMIFQYSSYIFFVAAFFAAIFVAKFEKRKAMAASAV